MNAGTASEPVVLTKENVVAAITEMRKVLEEQAVREPYWMKIPWLDRAWVRRRMRHPWGRTAHARHASRRLTRSMVRMWEAIVKEVNNDDER